MFIYTINTFFAQSRVTTFWAEPSEGRVTFSSEFGIFRIGRGGGAMRPRFETNCMVNSDDAATSTERNLCGIPSTIILVVLLMLSVGSKKFSGMAELPQMDIHSADLPLISKLHAVLC